ncbi:hypothetical protein OE88DRAFT_1410219 [Heliocybe sulcata]|uniref:Uncharacterized protein n=1 Tax=Heliocybe sulcata TaxID=5364 RepID=A0A5C3N7P3_9AGAM|nr:hypothetical protein OE88DRAFT_1410219 [Heliocybe sulcata]
MDWKVHRRQQTRAQLQLCCQKSFMPELWVQERRYRSMPSGPTDQPDFAGLGQSHERKGSVGEIAKQKYISQSISTRVLCIVHYIMETNLDSGPYDLAAEVSARPPAATAHQSVLANLVVAGLLRGDRLSTVQKDA